MSTGTACKERVCTALLIALTAFAALLFALGGLSIVSSVHLPGFLPVMLSMAGGGYGAIAMHLWSRRRAAVRSTSR